MAITNLYKELGVSQELTVEEIQSELIRQERVWHQREIIQPEKAHIMLAFLDEAKRAFATKESKTAYDQMLAKESEVDTGEDQLVVWLQKAKDCFYNKQYDIALQAIKKAGSYQQGSMENADLCYWMSIVLRCNNHFSEALDNINMAIAIDATRYEYYIEKGYCYSCLEKLSEAMNAYYNATAVADNNGTSVDRGIAYGYYSWFVFSVLGQYDKAEEIAMQAIKYGDQSGFGNKVVEAMLHPQEVPLQSLDQYGTERYGVEDETQTTISSIIKQARPALGEDVGWVLAEQNMSFVCPSNLQIQFWGQRFDHRYLYVLDTSGQFVLYDSNDSNYSNDAVNYDENNRLFRKKWVIQSDKDKEWFMREFDYECTYKCKYDHGNMSVIVISDRLVAFEDDLYRKRNNQSRLESESARGLQSIDLSYKLIRSFKKGEGLLKALKDILDKQEDPQPIYTPARQQREQERRQELEKQKQEEERRKTKQRWMEQGRCAYCGGDLKGLLTKKCSSCGRVKDY